MEKINKVHFYITRDEDETLVLWLGKPKRDGYIWVAGNSSCVDNLANDEEIEDFGLNINDYNNLTWDDEPLEVFINCDNL